MKTTKMYQIRENGRGLSSKLRSFARARKLAARLRRMGHDVNLAALNIAAPVARSPAACVLGRTDIKL